MTAQFAQKLDLEKARLIAVQNDGRLKTLDTLARETVKMITGSANFTVAGPGDKKIKQDPVVHVPGHGLQPARLP